MDVTYPLMVVGTAERHIQVFNLQNPTTPFKVSRASMYNCELPTYALGCVRLLYHHLSGRLE